MHGLHVAQLFTLLGSHGEVHAVEAELATAEGAFLLFRGGPEQAEFQAVVGGGSRGGGLPGDQNQHRNWLVQVV